MDKDKRIMQLEVALECALDYMESLMGSDYNESETVAHLVRILNGEA